MCVKAQEKMGHQVNIFFISPRKQCGYSLEGPRQGVFNEYPQHMFLQRNKQNPHTFCLKNMPYLELWAQLFKTNDVVSSRFVKIYIQWYANMLKFFAEKNVSSFCTAKNIRKLYIESAKTVNEMTLNKLVKLKTLWTTGPWCIISLYVLFPSFQLKLRRGPKSQ